MLNSTHSVPFNFCGLTDTKSSYNNALFVIIPVPYDLTSSYQSGSRRGPMAIIEASTHLELFDEELDMETFERGIHTTSFLEATTLGPKEMVDRVYKTSIPILESKKIPVLLGGEHSLTLGLVKAAKKLHKTFSVLQFDAHADLRQTYQDSPFNHACVARRLSELTPLTQVGIRSLSIEERKFLDSPEADKIKTFYARANQKISKADICNSLADNVYITIDLDVLDPSIMPSTGTPEPGGLNWYEILDILKDVAIKKRIVGFDVMELCPLPGIVAPDFLAAKLIYRLMGYILLGINARNNKSDFYQRGETD